MGSAEAGFTPAERNALFSTLSSSDPVAIAVSGGPDSMGLLRLAHGAGLKLTALTVDHGLRPESAAEALQVSGWCAALGVLHVVLAWEGEKPTTGIQAKAREARYRLMTDWCRARGVSALLVAHTLEDQAETVLMRLARRAPVEGLAAMYRVSMRDGIWIHRPLLTVPRDRVHAELARLGQPFLIDPSNADRRFERVRVREAMPALAAAGVTAAALAQLASNARLAVDAIGAAALTFLAHEARHDAAGFGEVSLWALMRLPLETQLMVLDLLISAYGGGGSERGERELVLAWLSLLPPPPGEGVSRSETGGGRVTPDSAPTRRFAPPSPGGGGRRRTLGGAIIVARRAALLVGREPGRIAEEPVPGGGGFWDNRYDLFGLDGHTVIPARDVPGLRRDPKLPAFIQQSLPAVYRDGEPVQIGGLPFKTPIWINRAATRP